jgi:hypothetical protein
MWPNYGTVIHVKFSVSLKWHWKAFHVFCQTISGTKNSLVIHIWYLTIWNHTLYSFTFIGSKPTQPVWWLGYGLDNINESRFSSCWGQVMCLSCIVSRLAQGSTQHLLFESPSLELSGQVVKLTHNSIKHRGYICVVLYVYSHICLNYMVPNAALYSLHQDLVSHWKNVLTELARGKKWFFEHIHIRKETLVCCRTQIQVLHFFFPWHNSP